MTGTGPVKGTSSWLCVAKDPSVVLLQRDLPVVGAGLGGYGSGGSRRGEFRNDLVDMTTAVADHKHDGYTPEEVPEGTFGTFRLITMLLVQSKLT